MGGMGFIESNQSVLLFNNTMLSFNMLEAARAQGAARYFYSSTACVYNEDKQLDPTNPGRSMHAHMTRTFALLHFFSLLNPHLQQSTVGLKESDAWPAKPQDTYGLEKLYAEEMCLAYARDFDIVTRVARYHNVYGPQGTWKGGQMRG